MPKTANCTVREAIEELVRHQKKATYNEIASVTGMKKIDVLRILNENENLIRLAWKRSNPTNKFIIGLRLKSEARGQAWVSGRWFKIEPINYGVDKAIRFNQDTWPADAVERETGLKPKPYVNGGLGDSYTTQEILADEENLRCLGEHGFRNIDEYDFTQEGDLLWKE